MPRRFITSCPRTCVGAATLLCALLASTSASAAAVAGAASVTIVAPVIAREEAPLAFGSIDASTSDVVVTVNPDGTMRCSRAAACTGSASPAIFALTGTAGERVGVRVTDHTTLSSAAGDSLPVALTLASPQLDLIAGKARVAIGGEIIIPAGQAPGGYRGAFQVDVDYQ